MTTPTDLPARPERLNVNLPATVVAAMNESMELTGESKAETTIRALRLYAHVQRVLHSGGTIYTTPDGPNNDPSNLTRVVFL